jgi:hypothetical protein
MFGTLNTWSVISVPAGRRYGYQKAALAKKNHLLNMMRTAHMKTPPEGLEAPGWYSHLGVSNADTPA